MILIMDRTQIWEVSSKYKKKRCFLPMLKEKILCLEDDVAFLGENLNAGLAVRGALKLNESGAERSHATSAGETFWMPQLVECFDVSIAK